ncbi:hypothetical protein F5B20DRAFT_535555 [Whalleya microplaca]|nr:hypothetical protein F5B20DRAFT_535555 [Whalleya microplaca]
MAPNCYLTVAITLFITSIFFNPIVVAAVAVTAEASDSNDTLAALDHEALFPNSLAKAGFGPRYFMNGMPPIPPVPLAPAYFGLDLDDNDDWLSFQRKRQDVRQCDSGNHSCLEIGPMGAIACCGNDQYCFLDPDWNPKCCALGVTCGSRCDEDQLYCNVTQSTTITISSTLTSATDDASSPLVTETQFIGLTTLPACCGRPCSSSSFLCQSAFGGQCCPYGARCASDSQCLVDATTPVSTVVTPAPPGCTTAQISCAASDGGGCCNTGSTCTSATVSATITQVCAANLTVVDSGGSGSGSLSDGAKAGIGIGVVAAAAVVVGALTWFWIRRRRSARSERAGAGADGEGISDDLCQPYVPNGRSGGAMSETSGLTSGLGAVRPAIHQDGLLRDYFGPDAVAGPYTDREDDVSPPHQGSATRSSPSNQAGVPMQPMGPGDIMAPVEIDGRTARSPELDSGAADAGENRSSVGDEPEVKEETMGPFELYGSPGNEASPLSRDEASPPAKTQGPSPPP